jgi:hypothetical protein
MNWANWSARTADSPSTATNAPPAVELLMAVIRRIKLAGNVACASVHAAPAAVIRKSGEEIKRRNYMTQTSKSDRYVSFVGIEGEKNSRELIVMLRRYIDDPAKSNRFWDLFKAKLEAAGQPDPDKVFCYDELFLIHAYINNIREFFELHEDNYALALLDQIEAESC